MVLSCRIFVHTVLAFQSCCRFRRNRHSRTDDNLSPSCRSTTDWYKFRKCRYRQAVGTNLSLRDESCISTCWNYYCRGLVTVQRPLTNFLRAISFACFSTVEVIVISITTGIVKRQALFFRNVVVPSGFPPRAITLSSRKRTVI